MIADAKKTMILFVSPLFGLPFCGAKEVAGRRRAACGEWPRGV
jgi:hypothetical protein